MQAAPPTRSGTLDISTGFLLLAPFSALDLELTGARVIVQTESLAVVVDAELPSGAYRGVGTRGWQVDKKGTGWTYTDSTNEPVGGIVQMTIDDGGKKAEGRISVSVTGKNATYVVGPGDEPLRAVIALDHSHAPHCGDSNFTFADCAFDKKGTLTCARKN